MRQVTHSIQVATRGMFFEVIQESHELSAAMALLTSADDFAIQNVERGEQSGGAIAFVVSAYFDTGGEFTDGRF